MIEAIDLSAGYGDQTIVNRVSLRLALGETVALLGPNGCGKTTLLKTLCGIHRASAGGVRVNGVDLATLSAPARARRLAYV
ncbi:MAG: ATP-binding cassette domain-containing protein, partial [Thiomonas sp.]